MPRGIYFGVFLLATAPLWAQVASPDANDSKADTNVVDRMLTPPPVSGQAYPVALESEEHSNYLRYGVTFSSAYSDNVLGAVNGPPVSDVGYSVWPTVGLDETTSRVHWELMYAPGFTFYQHTSARNEADQNASLGVQYRLSPHVTFSAHDNFQRSSSVFNQPDFASGTVSGGLSPANGSVVPPLADRLSNLGNVEITYQYGANDMVGMSGAFNNLHYLDSAQVPGLWDASSQAGTAFYSYRISHQNYLGATYQYQRLITSSAGSQNETDTHGVFLFYTFQPTLRFSLSFLGGAQLANTSEPAEISLGIAAFSARNWTPAGGASQNWQGQRTGVAVSYSHSISSGGGLSTAVHLDDASAVVRQQFTRNLTGSLTGFYANNNLIGPAALSSNGHTLGLTAAAARSFGEHWTVQLGYTRMHLNYAIPVIAGAPDTNREFVSVSYNFTRPLGR